MRANGAGLRRLTDNPARDGSPAWSPDGTRIAFVSNRDGAHTEIYVMAPDGSKLRRLTHDPVWGTCPSWSPDSNSIAFLGFQGDEAPHVYSIGADGSGLAQLTRGGHGDYCPSWSPHGRLVAFARSTGARSDIYTITPGASETRRIATLPGGVVPPISWSPDSTEVAFQVFQNASSDIYTAAADGSRSQRITWSRRLAAAVSPVWQPKMSFQHHRWVAALARPPAPISVDAARLGQTKWPRGRHVHGVDLATSFGFLVTEWSRMQGRLDASGVHQAVWSARPGVSSKMPSLETRGMPRRSAVAAIHRSASCSRWQRACPVRWQATREDRHRRG